MTALTRGMIVDMKLDPTLGSETGKTRPCIVVTNDIYNARVPVIQVVPLTEWTTKKAEIMTNVLVMPTAVNGLTRKSIADCLQTRPVDRRLRLVGVRGCLDPEILERVDHALRRVFGFR